MRRIFSVAVALFAVTLLAAPNSAVADSVTVSTRSKLLGHSYVDGTHYAWGKVRMWLPDSSDTKRVNARCHVIVVWMGRGTKQGSGTDYVTTTVRAGGRTRVHHYNVALYDPLHLYKNIPNRRLTGCR